MSNTNSVTNNFEIKSYWLYNGLREIVVLESSLDKIITVLHNLDNMDNEKSIIDAISVIRDICNSIPILQRKKLIELSVSKIAENLNSSNNLNCLKSLSIFLYGLFLYGYRDHNRLSIEISEINSSIDLIRSEILSKSIAPSETTNDIIDHLYLFCSIFIRQISFWLEWNRFPPIESITVISKSKDKISKSLLFLARKFSQPLDQITFSLPRPFDQLLILSFYGLLDRKSLKSLFAGNTDRKSIVDGGKSKRKANGEIDIAAKVLKIDDIKSDLKPEQFQRFSEKLSEFIRYCESRNSANTAEIVEMLKSTPEVVLNSHRFLQSSGDSGDSGQSIVDNVFVNLLKLWRMIIKPGSINLIDFNLYFTPLVTIDLQESVNFREIILEILPIIISFQSIIKLQIIANPFWVLEMLLNCLKGVLYHSTINIEHSSNQRIELCDLVSEIGRVFEIIVRPQDKESWCRVLVVVPQQLFAFIPTLDYPIHQDIVRILKKTVLTPVVQNINKFAFKQMTTLIKGADKEICKDLLDRK